MIFITENAGFLVRQLHYFVPKICLFSFLWFNCQNQDGCQFMVEYSGN